MRMTSFVLCLLMASDAFAIELANGIYSVVDRNTKNGTLVSIADSDGHVVLGSLATAQFGKGHLRSIANDNETFFLQLDGAGPFSKEMLENQLAAYVGGVCVPLRHGKPDEQSRLTLYGEFNSLKSVKVIAASLSIAAKMRKHPGHQLSVKWVPKKRRFTPSKPVELTLTVENVGKAPVKFGYGGSDRGARDNKFAFTAQTEWPEHGKAVPDTGDADHEGGITRFTTLEPGETFTARVNIRDWFKFEESDYYVITCLYHIELQATNNDELEPIWDEYLAGQCRLRVRK